MQQQDYAQVSESKNTKSQPQMPQEEYAQVDKSKKPRKEERQELQPVSNHIRTCLHTYVLCNSYAYVHTYVHAYICTCICTCIHMYMHMYMHTYMDKCKDHKVKAKRC